MKAEVFFDFSRWRLRLFAPALFAHDARPVVVTLTEQLPAAYQFSIRVPDTVEANNRPGLAWPRRLHGTKQGKHCPEGEQWHRTL